MDFIKTSSYCDNNTIYIELHPKLEYIQVPQESVIDED